MFATALRLSRLLSRLGSVEWLCDLANPFLALPEPIVSASVAFSCKVFLFCTQCSLLVFFWGGFWLERTVGLARRRQGREAPEYAQEYWSCETLVVGRRSDLEAHGCIFEPRASRLRACGDGFGSVLIGDVASDDEGGGKEVLVTSDLLGLSSRVLGAYFRAFSERRPFLRRTSAC